MLTHQIRLKLFSPVIFLSLPLVLSGCGRIANHPLVNMAKEEVSINDRSQAFLGEPIAWNGTVTGRANEVDGIAAMQIPVAGSKAAATVIVEGNAAGNDTATGTKGGCEHTGTKGKTEGQGKGRDRC